MQNYVALGDLVLDIYHNSVKNEIGYYAGGSVWNDLINISKLNCKAKCYSIATCGNDWASEYILQLFCQYNIDIHNVIKLNKQTKRFNIIIDKDQIKSQMECPDCNQSIWYTASKLPEKIPERFLKLSKGIVIIDSLKKNVLELAKSFKHAGWFLTADVGYINHMRYMRNDTIKSLLCDLFGFIQMTKKVSTFLQKKLSCDNEQDLFLLLKCRYLSITDGGNGSVFLHYNNSNDVEELYVDALPTQAIDTTGAGDAYFSLLVSQLDNDGFFMADISSTLEKAKCYAAQRTTVFGALGIYEKIKVIDGDCKICGSKQRAEKTIIKSPRQRIATNTNYLFDRTFRALESNAGEKLREVLKDIHGHVLMVGTGGSFAAAEFAAKCVTQYQPDVVAQACHPRDIIIQGLNKIDAVILFSYSGKTKDIFRVYEMCQKKGIKAYIITKYIYSPEDKLYEKEAIISYSATNSSTKERGFISMAGTLIPMCIFGDIFYPAFNHSFRDFLKQCFDNRSIEFSKGKQLIENESHEMNVDIFSGIDTVCAAIDLESKFIESGLARVVTHEKKDFSHGRFNIIEKYPPDLVVYFDNVQGIYNNKLLSYLKKRKTMNIIQITTTYGDVWGDLDLVIAVEFFSKYISKVYNYDMARPDYPKDAMSLYKYSRKSII